MVVGGRLAEKKSFCHTANASRYAVYITVRSKEKKMRLSNSLELQIETDNNTESSTWVRKQQHNRAKKERV